MRLRLSWQALAVGVGTLSVGLGLGVPAAQAAPNVQLTTFAGYGLAAVPASVTASMSFKVPTVTGCTATNSEVAIGAGDVSGTGTAAKVSGAAVAVGCKSGKAFYEAVLTINNKTTLEGAVSAGDTIMASGSMSATKVSVSVKDTTHALSKSASGTGSKPTDVADGMTAVPVATGSTKLLPIPKFGTVGITSALLDGKTPKADSAIAVNMATAATGGTVKILTGALNGTGNGWTETWKHA
jgi:hypothetical protein